MEAVNEVISAMGHVFGSIVAWKIILGITVIVSGMFNVACWILEAAAVWTALADDDSKAKHIGKKEFKIMPKIEMIIVLVGLTLIILAVIGVTHGMISSMIILGIIGAILLALVFPRVKNVVKAIFFLVLDLGLVLLIRALIIGDGSSEAMLFGTSIIALVASAAITAMRGGFLVIENGKYKFNTSTGPKEDEE